MQVGAWHASIPEVPPKRCRRPRARAGNPGRSAWCRFVAGHRYAVRVNVTLRRRLATAVVVLPTFALSSACGQLGVPATNEFYQPGVGANDRSGTVDILHAAVVSAAEGSGTLVAGLSNNDPMNPDSLVEVTGAGDDQGLTVSTNGPAMELTAGGFVQLADDASVSVSGSQIQPGRYVDLTFAFERGESVTLPVPVVENTGEFAGVSPPASGTSTPSPTPTS